MSSGAAAKRDADRTREAILDAAERLFADAGYASTSLQEIGEAAGLSRGTPGYFFGSKQQLYRAVLERILTRAENAIGKIEATVDGGGSREEVLDHLIGAFLDFVAANPNGGRLLQWEALTGGRVLGELAPRSELARLIEGARRGLPAVGTRDPRLSLLALCSFPIAYGEIARRTFGIDPGDEAVLAAHKQYVLALVLAGLDGGSSTQRADGG